MSVTCSVGLKVMIIISILTEYALIWWLKTVQVTTRIPLDKVYRLIGVSIIAAMKTRPALALGVMLHLSIRQCI